MMKEAMFWSTEADGRIRCRLCHQRCRIADGHRGLCGVRENRRGTLYSLVYGRVTAQAADPIEKKPLYHVLPGSRAFSIATRGCNFRCLHCQNCTIAHVSEDDAMDDDVLLEPDRAVAKARSLGCASIAYTYTEPTIFFEYALDIARRASDDGLRNVFVTNGYISEEALEEIGPYLDAANIDLKFFREDVYREVCGARLQPVLDMIRHYRKLGIWIELTTLIIPGLNDDETQLREMADFIASVGSDVPWHVTAFFPTYRMQDRPPTPARALLAARRIGKAAGLKYVYTGNIRDHEGTQTVCPDCGAVAVERGPGGVAQHYPGDGHCPECGRDIEGIWMVAAGGSS